MTKPRKIGKKIIGALVGGTVGAAAGNQVWKSQYGAGGPGAKTPASDRTMKKGTARLLGGLGGAGLGATATIPITFKKKYQRVANRNAKKAGNPKPYK